MAANQPIQYDIEDTDEFPLSSQLSETTENALKQWDSMKYSPRFLNKASLYDRFRARKGNVWLSVTSLATVGPGAWCEQQNTYNLLLPRYLRAKDRPSTIITDSGKQIYVRKEITIAQEKVLDRGKQVHAVLEKEIHPEQVVIKTITPEDTWGLKLLNLLTSLETLYEGGKAREIQLFGFVNHAADEEKEYLVYGVVDEIVRRELPTPKSAVTEAKPAPDGKGTLHAFFSTKSQSTEKRPAPPESKYAYIVSDSKTRRSRKLPAESQTVSSQFQLHLYKHLFDILATDSFDYQKLWQHLKLDPDVPFSGRFKEDSQALNSASNLQELVNQLRPAFLKIGSLSTTMEITYRLRERSDVSIAGSPADSPARKQPYADAEKIALNQARNLALAFATYVPESGIPVSDSWGITTEAAQSSSISRNQWSVSQATSSSVKEFEISSLQAKSPQENAEPQKPTEESQEVSESQDIGESQGESLHLEAIVKEDIEESKPEAVHLSPAKTSAEAVLTPDATEKQSTSPKLPPPIEPLENVKVGEVLSTSTYTYNPTFFNSYLQDALAYWSSQRTPRGVKPEDTNRCERCEFRDGCEWRDAMAQELWNERKRKRMFLD